MKKPIQIALSLIALTSVGANAQNISAGYNSTLYICGATATGTGENTVGQLGDGTLISKNIPGTVSGLANVRGVAAHKHSLFLLKDSTVWSVGQNYSGELGNGTTDNASTPVKVLNLTGIISIKSSDSHSLFLKNDGTVWACGSNVNGELGDGTTKGRSTPVQVKNMTDVVAIAAGTYHSLFLKSDGTVWSCGYNLYRQLGVEPGSTSPTTTPVQATVLPAIKAIAAAGQLSIFISTNDSLYSSGYSDYNMIAGSSLKKASTTLYDLKSASIGLWHVVYIKNDNTAWASGLNNRGQLGDGTKDYSNTKDPVKVLKLTEVTEAVAGNFHSLFLQKDGSVFACGQNGSGQFGTGNNKDTSLVIKVNPCGGPSAIDAIENTGSLTSVYPNPSNGLITIFSDETINEVVFYNAMGAIVSSGSGNLNKVELDLSNQPKGIYFYRLTDSKNRIAQGKVILTK